MKDTITLTKVNCYGQTVTREIKVGDTVIRKDKGGFYTFTGLTANGKASLFDGHCASATSVDNLRF